MQERPVCLVDLQVCMFGSDGLLSLDRLKLTTKSPDLTCECNQIKLQSSEMRMGYRLNVCVET